MMNQGKIVLLCDDTEVKGNGDGSVRELILNPVTRFVKNLIQCEQKATFFVDMAHFIYLEKHENNSDDYVCFLEAIRHLFDSGMDVQLHLHPQWYTRFKDPTLRIDSRWNLGLLAENELRELVTLAKQRLESIGRDHFDSYRVIAFKAGSWGLTPLNKVIPVLAENQIQIVIGPSGNITIPNLNVNYSRFRSSKGVISLNGSNLILMTEIKHSLLDILFLAYGVIRKRNRQIVKSKYSLASSPLKGASLSYFHGVHYVTHLRMNWQSPSYIVRVLKKYFNTHPDVDYVYVEMHTKDFGEDQFLAPKKFKSHLGADYNFITISEYGAKFI